MNILQKYRAKRAVENQKRKFHLEQSEANANENLNEATLKMLGSFCGVRGNSVCSQECVQWREGHVNYYPPPFLCDGEGFFYTVRPSCRLWGK